MKDERIQIAAHEPSGPPLLEVKKAADCCLILFGAGGDLAKRKLFPALYHLERDGLLPENLALLGTARTARSPDAFRTEVLGGLEAYSRSGKVDPAVQERLAQRMTYVPLDFSTPGGFAELAAGVEAWAGRRGAGANRLYYLATPPSAVPAILEGLNQTGLLDRLPPNGDADRWDRVIFEKPFGRDLESALRLNEQAARHLEERQIFRIDHYLGKETVQNILVFRFANAIFEPIWNRQHVDYVEITAAEQIGVGGRGGFYDEAGALRDVIQNHLLQVLSLVAMEPPIGFAADFIRDEKVKLLRSLRPLDPADAVRGQYRGYPDEPGVAPGSTTETFVAVRAFVDNWRWRDVPFYLRAGKKLAAKRTEVAITFKKVPHCLFGDQKQCPSLRDNVLKLRIQPDEGISLCIASKVPGQDLQVGGFTMDFRYAGQVAEQPREAYERLLLNAMRGDATLFARRDGVDASWQYVQPLLDAWASGLSEPPQVYEPGGQGPAAADALPALDGHSWIPLD